jgi:hypothetical protein
VDNLALGASTWTYLQACDLQAAVRRLQTLGYRRFDVLTIPPHLWPYDIDVAQRHALRDLLVTLGVSFDSLNLPSLVVVDEGDAIETARVHRIMLLWNASLKRRTLPNPASNTISS